MPAGRTIRNRRRTETGTTALRRRIAELSARLEEAEATLLAIRGGEVDAVIVGGSAGDRVFTLEGADHAYRIFLEDMGDGAVTLTREGLILYANRRFAEIVGAPLEQVIGSSLFRYLSPSDGDSLRASLAGQPAAGTRGEASFETPRGRVSALVSLNALPKSDPPACCMVVTDLTERERAHQELRKAHGALAESERRFRSLVDSSLVGFLIAAEGRIVFANAEQQRILGRLPIPAAVKELQNVFPEERDRFERLCDEAFVAASGIVQADVRFCPENRAVDAMGPLWAHCRAVPIEYQGRKAVLVNMVDVTRTREMEQIAFHQEKMASLGHFTAGIAHNIRNPLSGMNVYVHTMKNLLTQARGLDGQTRKEADQILGKLLQASNRISSVIRQVLDFAKPSSAAKTRVDVVVALRAALELSRMHLSKNGIAVEAAVPEGLPPCYADAGLLEQVFINVINNAAQALENRSGDRKISIKSELSDGFVVVRIADSGPGVPGSIQEKIFEPFYTTRRQGTGIGLAFSRRVLEGVGGHIDVGDSDLGGAEFRIRIPAGDSRNTRRSDGSDG